MSGAMNTRIEGFGEGFSRECFMEARARTLAAMEEFRRQVRPGQKEEEAYEALKAMLAKSGFGKNWHRPYVRFGKNTMKAYGEPSEPGVILGENDIFFLDIGPVYEGYEGDTGATWCIGDDEEMKRCSSDVVALFNEVSEHWQGAKVSGRALYDFAERAARSRGWIFNAGVNGHRLSEFPHQAYFKGGLGEIETVPIAGAWILEIQILHPTREFGAFYEDLLIDRG